MNHRHSIRLQGYDYSQAGWYFVTICTQNRKNVFGTIGHGDMHRNDAGLMIEQWYRELEHKFPHIQCHEMVIMPNHFHCIIQITGTDVGADLRVCPCTEPGEHAGSVQGEHAGSPLHRVVQWFKTMTTNAYIRGVKQNGWQRFDKRLWQRNYWEHIIRSCDEMNRISHYIKNNPTKWYEDRLNDGAEKTLIFP